MLIKNKCSICESITICCDSNFEVECSGCGAVLCVQDGEPCDEYDLEEEEYEQI